mmetsp:Transcript_51462/g.145028  ORF Transcript_51462/g.145028 Transcript_51462/m.145028 type:complete len:320 (+) Transcript_51462:1187-2146(+)
MPSDARDSSFAFTACPLAKCASQVFVWKVLGQPFLSMVCRNMPVQVATSPGKYSPVGSSNMKPMGRISFGSFARPATMSSTRCGRLSIAVGQSQMLRMTRAFSPRCSLHHRKCSVKSSTQPAAPFPAQSKQPSSEAPTSSTTFVIPYSLHFCIPIGTFSSLKSPATLPKAQLCETSAPDSFISMQCWSSTCWVPPSAPTMTSVMPTRFTHFMESYLSWTVWPYIAPTEGSRRVLSRMNTFMFLSRLRFSWSKPVLFFTTGNTGAAFWYWTRACSLAISALAWPRSVMAVSRVTASCRSFTIDMADWLPFQMAWHTPATL